MLLGNFVSRFFAALITCILEFSGNSSDSRTLEVTSSSRREAGMFFTSLNKLNYRSAIFILYSPWKSKLASPHLVIYKTWIDWGKWLGGAKFGISLYTCTNWVKMFWSGSTSIKIGFWWNILVGCRSFLTMSNCYTNSRLLCVSNRMRFRTSTSCYFLSVSFIWFRWYTCSWTLS